MEKFRTGKSDKFHWALMGVWIAVIILYSFKDIILN